MLPRHAVAHDDGRRGEAHVHAPRHDHEAHERLRPVDLLQWHGREQDVPRAEREHGNQHDGPGAELVQQEAGGDGGNEAGQRGREELRGGEKGPVVTQDEKELPEVEEPDAEGGPSARDAAEDEACFLADAADGDERVRSPGFDEEEGGDEEEADDEEDVDVGCGPLDERCLVPGDVDEDEPDHAGQGARDVEAAPEGFPGVGFGELGGIAAFFCTRDDEDGNKGHQHRHNGHDPECPWPPDLLC